MPARQDGPQLSVDQIINDKLCAILGIRDDTLILDRELHEAYDMDSLDVLQFVLDLEDAFSIEISDEETQHLQTLRQVIACVKRHLPGGEGPIPKEFEIREAYEVYSIPSSWNRRDTVGRVWDKSVAEAYVNHYNANKTRGQLMLHWFQVRVIFIRGSWYAVLKTPLSIKTTL